MVCESRRIAQRIRRVIAMTDDLSIPPFPDRMNDAAETVSEPTSNNKTRWRDYLKVHPAADLFPMMSEPELRELVKLYGAATTYAGAAS
jgi:hypothetical protein